MLRWNEHLRASVRPRPAVRVLARLMAGRVLFDFRRMPAVRPERLTWLLAMGLHLTEHFLQATASRHTGLLSVCAAGMGIIAIFDLHAP